MKNNRKVILKVLVGSRAHGLADKNSDYDYRSVYVLPTSKILSLNYKYKGTHWNEGEDKDNTSYEICHFLELAMNCNPTILEVFKAPVIEMNGDGKKLRELFQYVWNPKQAFDAFVGYGLNQRKKFLDKKDNRQNKYAIAYIRTLYNLNELLGTKNFHVKIDILRKVLMEYKVGNYTMEEVINQSENMILVAKELLPKCKHKANKEKIEEFLLKIRKRYW